MRGALVCVLVAGCMGLESLEADRWEPTESAAQRLAEPAPELSFAFSVLTEVQFFLEGASPGEQVFFVIGHSAVTDGGPCVAALGDLCIDMLPPMKRRSAVATEVDGIGWAQLTVWSHPFAPGDEVCAQAYIVRGEDGVDAVKGPLVCVLLDESGWGGGGTLESFPDPWGDGGDPDGGGGSGNGGGGGSGGG
jgi:hypothetical protein